MDNPLNTTMLSLAESTQNDTAQNIETATSKAAAEISQRIEEVFAKALRNMEHNTRVFQEKHESILRIIDYAEEQIKRVMAQLDPSVEDYNNNSNNNNNSRQEPSIALSENTADITLNSLNPQ